jgi:hypothetical protein
MIVIDWKEEIDKRLILKGLSLSTSEQIMLKHKVFFNEIIRDLLICFPNKQLFNIIMSMREYYDIVFIAQEMLDEYNKLILKKQSSKEYNIPIKKPVFK